MKRKDKIAAMWVSCIFGLIGSFGTFLLYDNHWGILTYLPWLLITFIPEDEE